jgi:branched-chain amino acid transport system substrate-binding protein
VARVNAGLDPNQQMQLIGNDALYSDETLRLGKQAVEGMVLTAPWYPNTPYAEQATERWNTEVSWRTAYSYDAAKALLAAIETADSREGVLQALRQVSLPASETSGDELEFDAQGNRVGASVQLVQIVAGTPTLEPDKASTPEESPSSATPKTEFKFELLK